MLAAQRNAGLAVSRHNDVVDEAGEWGNASDEESGDGAPVARISGRVSVNAVEVVHIGYGHVAAPDDEVAAARDKWISGYRRGRWGLYGIVGTNSVMRMEVMGPRKIVYPPRNARNFAADARIFHYNGG